MITRSRPKVIVGLYGCSASAAEGEQRVIFISAKCFKMPARGREAVLFFISESSRKQLIYFNGLLPFEYSIEGLGGEEERQGKDDHNQQEDSSQRIEILCPIIVLIGQIDKAVQNIYSQCSRTKAGDT